MIDIGTFDYSNPGDCGWSYYSMNPLENTNNEIQLIGEFEVSTGKKCTNSGS